MSPLPSPQRHAVTVVHHRRASERTLVLQLALPAGHGLVCLPGQFIGLEAPDGRARYFSVANEVQADGHIELHINRVPGGHFTPTLFEQTQPGDTLWLQGPWGDFALQPEPSHPLILVAGGTGWAPIKSCLLAWLRAGRRHPAGIHLYWGVRTAADLYDLAGVSTLCAGLSDLRFVPVVDQGDAPAGGRQGQVHRAVIADFPQLAGEQLYACGAPVMVEALVRDASAQCGFDPERLVADVFVTGEVKGEAPADAAAPPSPQVPLLIDTASGPQTGHGHVGDTLLQALRRSAQTVPSVCGGKGACGTCAVHIAPAWRDRLPPPTRREARLLEFLGNQAGHRLSCQILLEAGFGGLQLALPTDNAGH